MDRSENTLRDIYYYIKPLLPRRLQITLRQIAILGKKPFYRDVWPIDERAKRPPQGWIGWPDGKRFAVLLTHDVETIRGQEKCMKLTSLEQQSGFRSSYNFVAKAYEVSPDLRRHLINNGFEVGMHGLYHNGNPFSSLEKFRMQAVQINQYLKEWGAVGFRSPSMFHNLDWIPELNIEYDASTFDTDPFEPQPDGVSTIFPFWVKNGEISRGFVELPYTLPQDFTLFILMKQKNIDTWKRKLDWIAQNGGMALVSTHPDYMNFSENRCEMEEYPKEFYEELLDYIKRKYDGQYWNPLPKEMARFWKEKMAEKGTGRQ